MYFLIKYVYLNNIMWCFTSILDIFLKRGKILGRFFVSFVTMFSYTFEDKCNGRNNFSQSHYQCLIFEMKSTILLAAIYQTPTSHFVMNLEKNKFLRLGFIYRSVFCHGIKWNSGAKESKFSHMHRVMEKNEVEELRKLVVDNTI